MLHLAQHESEGRCLALLIMTYKSHRTHENRRVNKKIRLWCDRVHPIEGEFGEVFHADESAVDEVRTAAPVVGCLTAAFHPVFGKDEQLVQLNRTIFCQWILIDIEL